MSKSTIEWTDETWNPVAGCTKVSAGCKHCYAERMAKRLVAMGVEKYAGTVGADGRWTGSITFDYDALETPFKWRKPRRVFVNSMSDLFHEDVPFDFIDRVFAVVALSPQHIFQVLTKRPNRMMEYLGFQAHTERRWKVRAKARAMRPEFGDRDADNWWPLRNLWLGVSVEDQVAADARIPALLQTPAAVRFLSCEPLLGPVDLGHFLCDYWRKGLTLGNYLDWVICGGESGPGARPMHPEWVRSLRDQCVRAGVPFFFKQWGAFANGACYKTKGTDYTVLNDGTAYLSAGLSVADLKPEHKTTFQRFNPYMMCKCGKAQSGRTLDGREWNEFPGLDR